jgi:L-iditol 2-dehydrogenase
MRAVQFYEPGVLRLEQVDLPNVGPDEILVKIAVTLTCGTDLKMYKRGHPFAKPPQIIGHEFAGVVTEVGGNVQKFKEGMRVVAANSAPCNSCFFCRRGKQNLCEHLNENVIGFSWPGAYAEYVRVPAHIVKQNTHQIPSHVSFKQAAVMEPLACVVHGIELAGIGIADTVVVIGAGPIGLLHLQLARRSARRVIVSDLSRRRLDTAQQLGADQVIEAGQDDQVKRVKELTHGKGADIVIEAAGLPETWEKAVAMTRPGGTTLLFGGCRSGTTITLDTGSLHYGEMTIKGAFHHTPSCVEKALNLIASGAVKAGYLVGREMPLAEVANALDLMAKGEAVKVAIRPDL